jgi:nucleotide-binding universal stress UspA family protein
VPAETVVRFGEPAQEILVEAEAFDADMIVLTAARRSWLARLTGSGLGEKLLHASPVPVVLVRDA